MFVFFLRVYVPITFNMYRLINQITILCKYCLKVFAHALIVKVNILKKQLPILTFHAATGWSRQSAELWTLTMIPSSFRDCQVSDATHSNNKINTFANNDM